MFYNTLLVLFFLGSILPEPLDDHSIIIIPILREHRTNHNLPTRQNYESYMNDRIDMEDYEEPTDMPNIDNLDYVDDKDELSRILRFDNSVNVDDVLRYFATRNNRKYRREQLGENNSYSESTDDDNEESYNIYHSVHGDNKIVGGDEVDINLYPYHVAYGTNCGGAIIDKRWAITAGHCGKKPYIRVGSKYFNQGNRVGVKRSYIHPQWSAANKEHPFDYDFQLLELNQDLIFGDNIQPVKIARIEDMVIGKVVTVTGWGNTYENGPYSSVLRAVRVPIVSKESCQHVPFPYFRGGLTSRMFCAGYAEGKKDACQGDSGGPAVSNDRLLGMVSFGYGCATPGSYGVYSKVAKVRPWIEEVTGLYLD